MNVEQPQDLQAFARKHFATLTLQEQHQLREQVRLNRLVPDAEQQPVIDSPNPEIRQLASVNRELAKAAPYVKLAAVPDGPDYAILAALRENNIRLVDAVNKPEAYEVLTEEGFEWLAFSGD
jgi:hypothetical protein